MSPRAPLLVGLVLIAATASLTLFVMSTSKDQFGEDSTYALYADFIDASGIRTKTRLQINGIDVGKIESIQHVRGTDGRLKARVKLRLLNEFPVYEDAQVRKAAESLLGDFRLDLDPGTPNSKRIAPEGLITNVQSFSDMEEIQSQLRHVASNVNNVTESLSRVLSGPEGEGSLKQILRNVERSMDAVERTSQAIATLVGRNDRVVEQMISDLQQFSHDLATSTHPGGDMRQTAENLVRLTGRLDRIAASVEGIVGGEELASTKQGQLRQTVASLNDSIERLSSIARKVDEGRGTVGRIVNDPTLINKVEDTLDDAQSLIGGISRMETEVELRSQYEVPFARDNNNEIQAAVKNVLALRLVPRPDKAYILEAISDPRGTSTRKIVSSTTNGTTDVQEVNEISYNDLKFSAQFAKRYYFLTLRFGIIENTGGLGADFYALGDRVELRLDAFDFTRRDPERNRAINPRFRSTAMVGLLNHVSVQAGIDDPFNSKLRTWFLGGVLRFTDEDLKALLTVAPTPSFN